MIVLDEVQSDIQCKYSPEFKSYYSCNVLDTGDICVGYCVCFEQVTYRVLGCVKYLISEGALYAALVT